MRSEPCNDIAKAMAQAQGAMDSATFNAENPHLKNKYANLAAVVNAIRAPLSMNGICWTQTPELRDGGQCVLVTTLLHTTGQWISCEYPIPISGKHQDVGSAISYGRRYSLMAICGLAAEGDATDDDGNAAKDLPPPKRTPPAPAPRASLPVAPKPPVNPDTGIVEPHVIQLVEEDELAWGSTFLAAIGSTKDEMEVDEWIMPNRENLLKVEHRAPTVYQHIKSGVETKRKSFRK